MQIDRKPGAAGYVDSLARPGGNATGFMSYEYSLSGKWLELLKEIAPSVTRVAVLRDAASPSGTGQFAAVQAVAPSLRVEVTPVNLRDAGEIEGAAAAFARSPNGGLILTASGLAQCHRDLIVTLAARHKLPAVYPERSFVAAGGLISYGSDLIDQFRQAAGYVDRILKGEKPADLPVQAPTKYETVDQPQDRQGDGPNDTAVRARSRQRGDRMEATDVGFRFYALAGGLLSYGIDQIDQWRGTARYVDRILRGETAADLPVQAPDKFELLINLKSARGSASLFRQRS